MKKRERNQDRGRKRDERKCLMFPWATEGNNWLRWILPTCQASSRNLLIKG